MQVERKVKRRQRFDLRHRLQIDEQVATADQVDARKRRIADHVVMGKQDVLAQLRSDPESTGFRLEKAVSPVFGQDRQTLCGIQSFGCQLERSFVHVGGKDLQARLPTAHRHRFKQQHRQRIRLLSRRTAGHPDPDFFPRRNLVEDLGNDCAFQDRKRFRITKKARHSNQQIFVERVQLLGMRQDTVTVRGRTRSLSQRHPPLDPPRDRRRLVVVEVQSVRFPQPLDHRRNSHQERALGNLGIRQHRHRRILGVGDQRSRHLFGSQHRIDLAGKLRTAWHAIKLGCLFGLSEHQTARFMHLSQSKTAVGASSRKDYRNRPIANLPRERTEEAIDRHTQALIIRFVERMELSAQHHQLGAWPQKIDGIATQRHRLCHGDNRHPSKARQQLIHHTVEVGRQVLNHHKCQPTVDRHRLKKTLQRFQSAGRRSDSHHKCRRRRVSLLLRIRLCWFVHCSLTCPRPAPCSAARSAKCSA